MAYESETANRNSTLHTALDRSERFFDNVERDKMIWGYEIDNIGKHSIFNNKSNTLSNPQKSWLYDVAFISTTTDGDGNTIAEPVIKFGSDMCPVLKISLPKAENKLVERWYKGTKKSFVVNQDRSGTTELEIQLRSDKGYNSDIFNVLGINPQDFNNFNHLEISKSHMFTYLDVTLLGDDVDTTSGRIRFYNPLIENVSFSDLSYNNSEAVTINLSIHYDWWDS